MKILNKSWTRFGRNITHLSALFQRKGFVKAQTKGGFVKNSHRLVKKQYHCQIPLNNTSHNIFFCNKDRILSVVRSPKIDSNIRIKHFCNFNKWFYYHYYYYSFIVVKLICFLKILVFMAPELEKLKLAFSETAGRFKTNWKKSEVIVIA